MKSFSCRLKTLPAAAAVVSAALLSAGLASPALASPFATTVESVTGFPATPGLYSDPAAVLGKPAAQFYDTFEEATYRTTVVSAPYGTATSAGGSVITTLGTGQSIVVSFDHNVENDSRNPYGIDLIVFGNSFFSASSAVGPNFDPAAVSITSAATSEPITVEVAQSLTGPWYAFTGRTGDGPFPTQGYQLNGGAWGPESDFTKPVNPALNDGSFAGQSVARAVALYDGSGGGAGFDLAASGFDWIRYVRLTGDGGEVDAIADVSPVPEPGSLGILVASGALLLSRRRRRGGV